MKIEFLGQASYEEWANAADSCDYATFFHTPVWSNVFAKAYPNYTPICWKFLVDGAAVLFPMVEHVVKTDSGVRKILRSNSAGAYGGWISDAVVDKNSSIKLAKDIFSRAQRISWRLNPFDPASAFLKDLGVGTTNDDFTQVLELGLGYPKLRARFSRGHKNDINRAKRQDVKFTIAETAEQWAAYYQVYADTLERWGLKSTSHYDFGLFKTIFEQNLPTTRLYLATVEEKIVCGILMFYHNRHAVAWHGATLADYFSYRPWHFLFDQILQDATAEGYSWLDFNPSGGHEGVSKHKKGFGTVVRGANMIRFEKMTIKKNISRMLRR